MSTKKRVILLWAVSFLFTIMSPVAQAEVVVVANKSVNTDNLDIKEIKKIFLGKKMYWENNQKITLYILTKSPEHKEFVKKYLSKSENQFTNYWKQLLFTGKGMMPHRVKAEEMIEKVRQTDGAIGYVPGGTATDGVKVVTAK